jgi:catechol 2,3-dioxygenase-like lactoylglutathione lyase family enzyme
MTNDAEALKIHLSLNASHLARAAAFYRAFFGVEPAKRHDDYVKFELTDPPVVFSLVPHAPTPGGSLSHLGLRVADAVALEATRQRLHAAGLEPSSRDGERLWVADPDGNAWEVYVEEGDAMPPPVAPPAAMTVTTAPTEPVVWEHYVTGPVPERIPHADATVDEVRLTGTFNAPLTEAQRAAVVAEARRVLRPGGKLIVHGLMGDRPFPGGAPALPGLAALVSRVPVHAEPLEVLRAAGFTGMQFVKFGERPWFRHDGVELREVKLIGWKSPADGDEPRQVVYRGPFRQAADDAGHVYPRGQRVTVPRAVWEQLRDGPSAGQFHFVEPAAAPACCV